MIYLNIKIPNNQNIKKDQEMQHNTPVLHKHLSPHH